MYGEENEDVAWMCYYNGEIELYTEKYWASTRNNIFRMEKYIDDLICRLKNMDIFMKIISTTYSLEEIKWSESTTEIEKKWLFKVDSDVKIVGVMISIE